MEKSSLSLSFSFSSSSFSFFPCRRDSMIGYFLNAQVREESPVTRPHLFQRERETERDRDRERDVAGMKSQTKSKLKYPKYADSTADREKQIETVIQSRHAKENTKQKELSHEWANRNRVIAFDFLFFFFFTHLILSLPLSHSSYFCLLSKKRTAKVSFLQMK